MKYILSLMVFISTITFQVQAENYPQMATMVDVQKTVDAALKDYKPSEILVIFDIDSTLIMSKDPALQRLNIMKYHDVLKQHMKTISHNARMIALNLCTQKPSQLVDVDTPKIINTIKNKGIKVIACTAASPGKFKDIEYSEKERFETLKRHGVDFSSAFPEHTHLTLGNVQGFLGRYPVFYQGVICSAGESHQCRKGISVVEFLQTTQTMPKIIIFIDDKKDYIVDLHEAIKRHFPSTNFIGIEFTGELNQRADSITEAHFIAYWKSLTDEAMREEKTAAAAA